MTARNVRKCHHEMGNLKIWSRKKTFALTEVHKKIAWNGERIGGLDKGKMEKVCFI